MRKFNFGILFFLFFATSFKEAHPFHLGLFQLKYDSENKSYQISCRLFINDFEAILKKNYNVSLDFYKESNDELSKKYIKMYLDKNVWLGDDTKTLNYNILGSEREDDALWIYLETEPDASQKQIRTKITLLYDLFDDQTNIVQCEINQQKKAFRNLNPKSEVSFPY